MPTACSGVFPDPPVLPDNIFLIGFMGAGKSSVGRTLARKLTKNFIDSDQEIERRTGVSVSWIFDQEGEAGFRARERALIKELVQGKNMVLATGGGVVLSGASRRLLSRGGLVVYLYCAPEHLLRRVAQDGARPLLASAEPLAAIRNLLVERDPLYREIADFTVDTGEQMVSGVVRTIADHYASL